MKYYQEDSSKKCSKKPKKTKIIQRCATCFFNDPFKVPSRGLLSTEKGKRSTISPVHTSKRVSNPGPTQRRELALILQRLVQADLAPQAQALLADLHPSHARGAPDSASSVLAGPPRPLSTLTPGLHHLFSLQPSAPAFNSTAGLLKAWATTIKKTGHSWKRNTLQRRLREKAKQNSVKTRTGNKKPTARLEACYQEKLGPDC